MMEEEETNKMKKYSLLQKKVEELESIIRSVVSGDDIDGNRQRLIKDSGAIEAKFQFLQRQIAAESSSPDHHLSHLAARLEKLHDHFIHVTNNLDGGEPVDPADFDDRSICSSSDSCLEDGGEKKTDGGIFKVYDNPLSSNGRGDVDDDEDDDDDVDSAAVKDAVVEGDGRLEKVGSMSVGGGDRWLYWKGVAAGAAAAVGSVVAVVLGYGVRCGFDEGVVGVFPPPT